jgi:two-component sensor histidine kinase
MALALAMALQELATNAVKYGSLSGRRDSSTSPGASGPASPPAAARWVESGGPSVVAPTRRGFGSRLIERSLAEDLGGTVTMDFAPGGVVCTVEAPLQS